MSSIRGCARRPHVAPAALCVVLLLASCGRGGSTASSPSSPAKITSAAIASSSTIEAIQKRGKLRVGLEAGYFPFEMKDRNGNFIGFDVEIAGHMAKAIGVELQIVNTDWDGIIPSLLADKFDIIMSGMTRTSKRALAVNFADPYFQTGQLLLVGRPKGDAIQSYKDLDAADKVVAVKQGTTGDLAATRLLPNAKIRKYQTEADAALEVNFGRADAFVYDEPFIRIWAKRHEEKVRAITKPFTVESLCWAVRKGDPDFVAWLNVFLADIKSDDPVETTYDRLYKKYFVDMTWQEAAPPPTPPAASP